MNVASRLSRQDAQGPLHSGSPLFPGDLQSGRGSKQALALPVDDRNRVGVNFAPGHDITDDLQREARDRHGGAGGRVRVPRHRRADSIPGWIPPPCRVEHPDR